MQEDNQASGPRLVIYWLIVGIPLVWGVIQTISKAAHLFM
ncbi:MAG TPA: oxalate:formate antiporter [Verrucomicrobiae bacterium]|nr:oxalate:formate antiporter [Verrucomicrobiae bacterium]